MYNSRPSHGGLLAPRKAVGQPMNEPKMAGDEVRVELLRRLAEQAMSDPDFRAVARDDLEGALAAYGYDLNERELALVARFRSTLADAGVDLDLVHDPNDERFAQFFGG